MSKKHYTANNTKYYKHSNSSGELGHILRSFNKNENAFEELTQFNFGHSFSDYGEDINQLYNRKLNEAKIANPKAFKKSSTTYIDSVLVFDNELMEELLSSENGQNKVNQSIQNYMIEFKEKYGYEPIGFNFHLDEGTFIKESEIINNDTKNLLKVKNPETGEDGYLKRNLHAHAVFLNFDFEKNKSVHRNMKKEDWSNAQDLLHKHFEEYGFNRGEPKQTKGRDHKNKKEYVQSLEKEVFRLKKAILQEQMDMADFTDEMIFEMEDGIDKINRFEKSNSHIKTMIKRYNTPQVEKIYKKIEKAFPKLVEAVKKDCEKLLKLLLPDFDGWGSLKMKKTLDKSIEQDPEVKPEQEIQPNKPQPPEPQTEEPEPPKPTPFDGLDELPEDEQEQALNEITEQVEKQKEEQKQKIKNIKNRRKYGGKRP